MTINFRRTSISLLVVLSCFLWATRSEQPEYTYTPGVRMLFDHEEV